MRHIYLSKHFIKIKKKCLRSDKQLVTRYAQIELNQRYISHRYRRHHHRRHGKEKSLLYSKSISGDFIFWFIRLSLTYIVLIVTFNRNGILNVFTFFFSSSSSIFPSPAQLPPFHIKIFSLSTY